MKLFGKRGIFGLLCVTLFLTMWSDEAAAQFKFGEGSSWQPKNYSVETKTSCPSGQEWSVVQNKCVSKSSSNGNKTSSTTGTKQQSNSKKSGSDCSNVRCRTSMGEVLDPATCTCVASGYSKVADTFNDIKENVTKGHDWTEYRGVSNDNKEGDSSAAPKGSAISGKVAEYEGEVSLTGEYYNGGCGAGNIFQQLACRAGIVGSGLRSVGYIIAGFGLLVFSFAAIFGKVKWNVFATIMFSVFLLSMTFYVINTFTSKGDPNWIAFEQIKGTSMGNSTAVKATDDGQTNVPDVGNERPK